MTDLLLLGILIMLILSFHYNTSSSGRYMKVYGHRLPRYLGIKTANQSVCLYCFVLPKVMLRYQKIKEKGVKLWQIMSKLKIH